MQLKNVIIENYRSIKYLDFPIKAINNINTFTLTGVNETGKSSFLKALSLINDGHVKHPADFFDHNQPIKITYNYNFDADDAKKLKHYLSEKGWEKKLIDQVVIKAVAVHLDFTGNLLRECYSKIDFKKNIISQYANDEEIPTKRKPRDGKEPLNLEAYFDKFIPNYFQDRMHQVTFWKYEPKYLITERVNLEDFAHDPQNVSVPLKNCFLLAGIDNISETINLVKENVAEAFNLQERLSDTVTQYVNRAWPGHPISLRFQISNMQLDCLIEDNEVRYKTKTTEQRSDGFKQFLSFLLSVSLKNVTNELQNSILLLDEPETHLHPRAQKHLLQELLGLSSNDNNNIVIYTTHSNFMIDKDSVNRCYIVTKEKNETTQMTQMERQYSSYAEVNFEFFGIASRDYLNELYDYLADKNNSKLKQLPQDKTIATNNGKKKERVSLPGFIRYTIHNPEQSKTPKYTEEELLKSIQTLHKIKYDK